jgi:hypothetical protein
MILQEEIRRIAESHQYINDDECDFIVQKDNGSILAVQVCYE